MKGQVVSKLTFISSNPNKIKEYQEMGFDLDYSSFKDLKEINADELSVIIYKTKEIPQGHIIEDTSLSVEGLDIGVNIKWLNNELKTNKSLNGRILEWTVLLGLNQNSKISIYKGSIKGILNNTKLIPDAFAFDDIFWVADKSLYELKKNSSWVDHPRFVAMNNLINENKIYQTEISLIPPWSGNYQNE